MPGYVESDVPLFKMRLSVAADPQVNASDHGSTRGRSVLHMQIHQLGRRNHVVVQIEHDP